MAGPIPSPRHLLRPHQQPQSEMSWPLLSLVGAPQLYCRRPVGVPRLLLLGPPLHPPLHPPPPREHRSLQPLCRLLQASPLLPVQPFLQPPLPYPYPPLPPSLLPSLPLLWLP